MYLPSTYLVRKGNPFRSLAVQTVLIVAGSLILAYSFSLFVYSKDRLEALTYLGLKNTALTAIHFAHAVAVTEPDWRESILARVDDAQMTASLTNTPAFEQEAFQTEYSIAFAKFLESGAHGDDFKSVRYSLSRSPTVKADLPGEPLSRSPHLLQTFFELPMHSVANVAVQMNDEEWLNISLPLPDYPADLWSPSLLPVGLFTLSLIIVSGWAVRRILRPLSDVTRAATEFAQDINAAPMYGGGSTEARVVAAAFNKMQHNIKAIVRSRTEMMGAISHDFRTPLTLIKLRTESLPASRERTRLLHSIEAMESVIQDSLAFAKQLFGREAKRNVDVAALLQSVCDDFAEAGERTECAVPTDRVIVKGNPVALRRAFSNLVGNAVKYGDAARVSVTADQCLASVIVDDDGPGISQEDMELVFEPFYRCDRARSDSGEGSGLGLSLARSVIEDHGGTIKLRTNEPHGLSALVDLPLLELK